MGKVKSIYLNICMRNQGTLGSSTRRHRYRAAGIRLLSVPDRFRFQLSTIAGSGFFEDGSILLCFSLDGIPAANLSVIINMLIRLCGH